jgi:hypothetical protein
MAKRAQHLRDPVNLEIRKKYWIPLEARHKTGAWEALDAGYTEAHRAYHSWEHIAGLFEKLGEFSGLSTRADIIAMSAFWHDVVHRTQDHDGSPRGFVARICRISPDVLNKIDEGRFQPGVLSCLSNII